MAYSLSDPSPGFRALLELQRSTPLSCRLASQAPLIDALISRTATKTILDFCSGKGQRMQYPQHWRATVTSYDPALDDPLPAGKFDGVIALDVLDHVDQADHDWLLRSIFERAGKFVFASVASYPVDLKAYANGSLARRTLRESSYWYALFNRACHETTRNTVPWECYVSAPDAMDRCANFAPIFPGATKIL